MNLENKLEQLQELTSKTMPAIRQCAKDFAQVCKDICKTSTMISPQVDTTTKQKPEVIHAYKKVLSAVVDMAGMFSWIENCEDCNMILGVDMWCGSFMKFNHIAAEIVARVQKETVPLEIKKKGSLLEAQWRWLKSSGIGFPVLEQQLLSAAREIKVVSAGITVLKNELTEEDD